MIKYLFSLLLLLTSLSAVADEKDNNITGAACFVSDQQGRILVTRDILTNKIAIPGGYVGSNTPKQAAKRETQEETGISVTVMGELARLGNAILFDCRAIEPIAIHNKLASIGVVSAWQSAHFGREVRAVYMMDPSMILASESRFPEQVQQFPNWLTLSTVSETTHFDDFSHQTSALVRMNAQLNRAFQAWVDSLPEPLSVMLATLLTYASAAGNGVLFLGLLPFAMASGGPKRTAELMLVTIAVAVVVLLMKLSFAVPRPFYIYPDLQLAAASGFAFPSGHTATAVAVWGLIYLWLKQMKRSFLIIWVIPSILVALSRVYLGVHYASDVVVGAVIGVVIVGVSHYLYQRDLLLTVRLWCGVGILLVPLALTQIHPLFFYCTIFSWFFALMLWLSKKTLNQPMNKGNGAAFLLTLLGIATIFAAKFTIEERVNSSIHIMIINAIGSMLLAVLIVVVPMLIKKKRLVVE